MVINKTIQKSVFWNAIEYNNIDATIVKLTYRKSKAMGYIIELTIKVKNTVITNGCY